jgi:hypothetical protein
MGRFALNTRASKKRSKTNRLQPQPPNISLAVVAILVVFVGECKEIPTKVFSRLSKGGMLTSFQMSFATIHEPSIYDAGNGSHQ